MGAETSAGAADTLQARRGIYDALRPPQAVPPFQQVAQAGGTGLIPGVTARPVPTQSFRAPPDAVVTDPQIPKAPGSGPPPPLSIPAAPRPVEYPDPGPEPQPPGPHPDMIRYRQIMTDPRRSPEAQQEAARRFEEIDKRQQGDFTRHWTLWKDRANRRQEYLQTQPKETQELEKGNLENIRLRRALEGEGAIPFSDEDRKKYGVSPGQTAYWKRDGTPQFGPVGTNVNVDTGQKMETEENKTRGKLAAEREGKLLEGASKAGSTLIAVNRAEALLDQIETGKLEPTKLTMGAFGRAIGVPDETLAKLGLKPDQIGNKQAFNAIANELVIGKIGGEGFPANNFSNPDRVFLVETVPQLGDDMASNRIKAAAARLVAQRDLEKTQAWVDYKRDPANKDRKSYLDFEFDWNAKVAQTDVTGELRKKADELIARGNAARPAVEAPAAAAAPAEGTVQRNRATGAIRVWRGGKWETEPNAP
jgi:hypothetical protein